MTTGLSLSFYTCVNVIVNAMEESIIYHDI